MFVLKKWFFKWHKIKIEISKKSCSVKICLPRSFGWGMSFSFFLKLLPLKTRGFFIPPLLCELKYTYHINKSQFGSVVTNPLVLQITYLIMLTLKTSRWQSRRISSDKLSKLTYKT